MPIYEYLCQQCGHRFEYLVLSSSSAPECPSCHKRDLTQLISLCAMTSEGTREANFKSAHKKASRARTDKRHEEQQDLRDHIRDAKG
jgi:putative FmdB family regulatory protein